MEYRDGLGQGWRVGAKALERMIDESSGDAHRWLDALLDLRDARTTLDATRAKLADLVRERDEARDKRAHETQHLLNCCAERDKALAASQAECARLREALEERGEHGRKCPWAYFSAGRPKDGGGYEMLYREAWYEVRPDDKRPACTCGLNAALASAPGSTDALREVVAAALAVQREISTQQYGVALSEGSISAIVSRILGERSDDAQQGRVERAKEGGDA